MGKCSFEPFRRFVFVGAKRTLARASRFQTHDGVAAHLLPARHQKARLSRDAPRRTATPVTLFAFGFQHGCYHVSHGHRSAMTNSNTGSYTSQHSVVQDRNANYSIYSQEGLQNTFLFPDNPPTKDKNEVGEKNVIRRSKKVRDDKSSKEKIQVWQRHHCREGVGVRRRLWRRGGGEVESGGGRGECGEQGERLRWPKVERRAKDDAGFTGCGTLLI